MASSSPPGRRAVAPQRIQDLARAMVRVDRAARFGRIQAGYTYLGQMISHDIVPSTRPQRRRVTGALELDSLYGPPGQLADWLDARGRFRAGPRAWDLWRARDGRACIPEARNDQNQIVAQLHRLWQRIHDAILDHGLAVTPEEARSLVVRLFQWVLVDDLLPQLLEPSVHRLVFLEHQRPLGLPRQAISPEFSRAAFRFGHSMVRRSYQLNAESTPREIGLEALFAPGCPIPEARRIDWRFFFSTATGAQPARAIDLGITRPLTRVVEPPTGPAAGVEAILLDLVVRNLQAGIEAGLPSGLGYLRAVEHGLEGRPKLPEALGLVPVGDAHVSVLDEPLHELPLWPYLLLEAAVQQGGRRLGTLGSLIVAETLLNAITNAAPSIFDGGARTFSEIALTLGPLGERIERAALAGRTAERPCGYLKFSQVVRLLVRER